jgi:hypothetical protein
LTHKKKKIGKKSKNYQHFDGVIHKIDDSDNQLDGFTDYILENYKFKNNDYHILRKLKIVS